MSKPSEHAEHGEGALRRTEAAPSATGRVEESARFEELVRPALPRVYRFCLALTGRRDTADDVFQETLLRAFVRRDTFEGRSDVTSWLCSIARNEHIEAFRADARRKGILSRVSDAFAAVFDRLPGGASAPANPERVASQRIVMEKALEELSSIPEEYRVVVLLVDVEGMSYEDVSASLALPIGTVKSRHARGRARLRARMVPKERSHSLRTPSVVPSDKEGGGT